MSRISDSILGVITTSAFTQPAFVAFGGTDVRDSPSAGHAGGAGASYDRRAHLHSIEDTMKHALFVAIVALFAFAVAAPSCIQSPPAMPPAATVVASGPAACIGADGLNHCGASAKSAHVRVKLFGASAGGTRTQTIPPSWTVPAWFIDPSITLSCASDNNNCTQNTCGAAGSFQGPCVTFNEIVDRWGTNSPRFSQSTNMTMMSSQLSQNDLVYMTNLSVQGASTQFVFQCALPEIGRAHV
jgi:hypothetical protein